MSQQVIHDFDDQDLSAYYGDTGSFGFTEITTGDYILSSSAGAWLDIFSEPGDGLNYYPQRGETLVCDIIIEDSSNDYDENGIYFGVQDSNNLYRVDLNQYQQNFAIYKDQTGDIDGVTPEDSVSATNLLGEYRVEIDWGTGDAADDEIVARYYSGFDSDTVEGTISITDAEYDDGGVGFHLWSEHDAGFNDFEADSGSLQLSAGGASTATSAVNVTFTDVEQFSLTGAATGTGSVTLDFTEYFTPSISGAAAGGGAVSVNIYAEITGSVFDSDENPISDATVYAITDTDVFVTTTDANGDYIFDTIDPDTYHVAVDIDTTDYESKPYIDAGG